MKVQSLYIFLFIGILFIPIKSHAQRMATIDILSNLDGYEELLEQLYHHELPYAKKTIGYQKLEKVIRINHTFIILELKCTYKEANDTIGIHDYVYAEVTFEIKDSLVVLKEFFSKEISRSDELDKFIKKNRNGNNFGWKSNPSSRLYLNEKISNYLSIADRIAIKSVNCTSGDNYIPGYYSEIMITDEFIQLSQLNRMNSKSLDHKDDYSIRDLEFLIPFQEFNKTLIYNGDGIGTMMIRFSDYSSPNNKSCGDNIKTQIEIEKAAFEVD